MAGQEIPGPMLAIVNLGYMFLYYPMIVVSILPLANHFMKLEKSWIAALIVATLVMFILLAIGGLKGEQIATAPAVPPTYLDNLARVIVSFISTMASVIISYVVMIIAVKIIAVIKKIPGKV